MSIQVLTAVVQSSSLNAANPLAAELPDGDATGMGFADLLALQMQLPELAIPATTTEGGAATAPPDPATLSDSAQQVSDLAAQLLPWLPQTPGLPGQQSPHGNTDAHDQRPLETGFAVAPESGRTLAQFASLNGQEHRAAANSDLAADKQEARLPALPAAASDNANPRTATPVFALPADNGKAGEVVAAKTAASNLETAGNAAPVHHAPTQAASAPRESATTPISTPLHDARWATDFGQKVVWIARAEQQQAQINIHPAQLGPIQITINLDGDKASAMFASAHAEVRQAIETALPRLREMMAEAGINLGQANVGSQFSQQQTAQENRHAPSESARLAVDNAILRGQADVTAGSATISHRGDGLVDLFA
ncbi:MAG TPA: flagellar hook-length control protein FliK [Rhodocyclaceae bacterium]|nr:flagellar hook-length control protein FliK [Rhodocyclaceae bacterium]